MASPTAPAPKARRWTLVLREPQSSRHVETLRPPATVAPLVAPDAPIPVADLLP